VFRKLLLRVEGTVGMVRVLVGDLVADGHVHPYRPGTPDARPDLALLERVLEGLRSI
jgi:Protein of unknown function (DUF742)